MRRPGRWLLGYGVLLALLGHAAAVLLLQPRPVPPDGAAAVSVAVLADAPAEMPPGESATPADDPVIADLPPPDAAPMPADPRFELAQVAPPAAIADVPTQPDLVADKPHAARRRAPSQSAPRPRPAPPTHPRPPVPSHPPSSVPGGNRQVDDAAPPGPSAGGTQVAAIAVPSAEAMADWRSALSDWLARNRRYPPAARQAGEEGAVTLRFAVDPVGLVLSSEILSGSGHDALDDAALAMLRGATVPAPPAGLAAASRRVRIAVAYHLTDP